MHIALILGSVRDGRKSNRVAQHLLTLLQEVPEVTTSLLDLATWQLPLLTDRWSQSPEPNPQLAAFSLELSRADGIILISPEYHGSYTGVLKNAIDHFWNEFKKKPIGVVSTGSGRFGGINASSEMQNLVLSLGAFPMPTKLIVPFVHQTYAEDATPTDERSSKDASTFIEEFVWFSNALLVAKQHHASQNTIYLKHTKKSSQNEMTS